jgi:hypothetical protein
MTELSELATPHFGFARPWISEVTIMRASTVLTALMLLVSAPARADPLKAAVFDLELLDTSLQGEVSGPRADEHDRLIRVGDQLRKEMAESGKFQLLDISSVNAAAHGSNLQACGGCDVQYAKQLGPTSSSQAWCRRSRTSFST